MNTNRQINISDELLTRLNAVRAGIRTQRFGLPHDGGYVIPTRLEVKKVITIGVGHDVSFETHLQNYNPALEFVFYDPSVLGLPVFMNNARFYQVGLSVVHGLSLKEIIANQGDHILLKIDCEGGEWNGDLENCDYAGVDCLVIEIHGLFDTARHAYYLACLLPIFQRFDCINIHGNNCVRTFDYRGVEHPNLMELTFLRKELTDQALDISAPPPINSRNCPLIDEIQCYPNHVFGQR